MKWKTLSLAFAFTLCGSLGWSLTLSDLLTQSRVYIRDTNSSRPRFSDSQLTAFLNNGQKEINSRAWCLVASTSLVLVSGTTEYSLPSDVMVPLRVTVGLKPLAERTFSFLDESNSAWIAEPSGTPREYYLRVDSSVVSNVTRESIGFHPVSSFTVTAQVQYLQQPVDLSVASDVPFAGNSRLYPYHQALAYYAAFSAYLSMGMQNEATLFYQQYSNLVDTLELNTANRAMFNPNLRGNRPMPVQK